MEHPGTRIFEGSEGSQLDTSVQYLEEDEAEEDQKHRNKEQPCPDAVHKACSPVRDKADEDIATVVATLESKHQKLLEQVAVLKQAMMTKPDKLRGECENSQVTEELAVCTEEVEQLKEQLQCCDKEWLVRVRAESDKWQDRLEEQQQDVETEQAKMAEAVVGWAEELQTVRKQYQEAEMRLTELQNKYRAAKMTVCWYKLWADGKERHRQQECRWIVFGLQNILQGENLAGSYVNCNVDPDVTAHGNVSCLYHEQTGHLGPTCLFCRVKSP